MPFTLPPNNRAPLSPGYITDQNNTADVLTGMGAALNVLNTAYAGGADPTGAADSLPAFNAAVTAASTTGGAVTMPPGTFTMSGTVVLQSNVTLAGAGVGATTIRLANGANTHLISPSGTVSNVTLRDFTADGNNANNPTGGHNIRLGYGFSDVRLQNVYSHNASLHGILTTDDGADNNRLWVTNCRCDFNGASANGSGLYVNRTFGVQVSGYQAYSNTLDGLQWKGGDRFHAANVICGTNGRYGIYPSTLAQGTVTGFSVYSATQIGVLVQTAGTQVTLADGLVYNGQLDGVRLDGVANCTLANLRVFDNNQAAGTNAGLRLTNGVTYTRILGSSFYDDQGVHTQKYGIWATGTGTNDHIKVSCCDTRGNVTASFQQDNWGGNCTVVDLSAW